MIKIKKSVLLSLLIVFILVLSACDSSSNDSENKNHTKSAQPARYTVLWADTEVAVDNNAIDNGDDPDTSTNGTHLIVKYIKNGKTVTQSFGTYKMIPADVSKPYITLKNGTAIVYRPPYIQYQQPAITGKVVGKAQTGEQQ